jgi:hypothetical protein
VDMDVDAESPLTRDENYENNRTLTSFFSSLASRERSWTFHGHS